MSKIFIIFLILVTILIGNCAISGNCATCGPVNHKLLEENDFTIISGLITELPKPARGCFIYTIKVGLDMMQKVDPSVGNIPKIVALKKALSLK